MALFVLDDAALAFKHRLGQIAGEEAHAIGFQIQGALQSGQRHVFKEVGAVIAGGAIAIVGAEIIHRLTETMRIVRAAIEEKVFEQMGKPGAATTLIARADVIPEVDGHQGHAVVFVHDHGEAVVEHEFFMRYAQFFDFCIDRVGSNRRCRKAEQGGEAKGTNHAMGLLGWKGCMTAAA